jgi:chromosome segregation protein
MRLERIEINGFKSFSDRSELAFDKGVTAIVGPNGCGKSNVADAITWVMGEQSAKSLRGERMEDVLFNGSDARKPTAAAEVRLRFSGVLKQVTGPALADDSDAAGSNGHAHANGSNGHGNGNGHYLEEIIQSVARDIEVTRRLYRSGESEYLIDGQACRLRDINDLLMDTGLGAKAYAIIEQGKIGLILSSRPTDRRQLIEEAAGVTKYKVRRRSAELKLEAARQNLTRVDDIVFEVEKQRGTLKRQAAKARRYQKLRGELRRWEKVLFARKYRQLAETIASTRERLAEAREQETASAADVAGVESHLSRIRIELAESEMAALAAREAAHARELEINRAQQQIAFDREQVETLGVRARSVAVELETLESRREPARALLAERRHAAVDADAERDRAAATLASECEAYEIAHREIEGFEGDVEAARSEVFSAINAATALSHSLEHAAAARERVAEVLAKLQVEADDARIEFERVAADRAVAAEGVRRSQEVIETTSRALAAQEAELASARAEHEWRARMVRTQEHELAGLDARLKSLEELEAARAEYGDAARTVLAQANGKVGQQGAVADYLEVERGYERAVEACLGDLLQHVIVERPEHAVAGFEVVREQSAGRCGFLIATMAGETPVDTTEQAGMTGLVPLSSIVRVNGPYAGAIRQAMGNAWVADGYATASEASRTASPVATIQGDLFRGPHLVAGGNGEQGRGILETKREIRDLRARIETERQALSSLSAETTSFEATIARALSGIARLGAEQHHQEKAAVGYEAHLQRANDETARLEQKRQQVARERQQAEDERDAIDRRQEEARSSIARLTTDQRTADERLTVTQRRLFEAREATEALSRRTAEAGATHAALVERESALAQEVHRLEEALAELELRAVALATDLQGTTARIEILRASIADGEARLDTGVRALEVLRRDVESGDDIVTALRTTADAHEGSIKAARAALETIRASVAELDILRATAESDLAHLAQACADAVQATLDEVLAEVADLERAGDTEPDARIICADEPDEDEGAAPVETLTLAVQQTLSAEEAIVALRDKIDRLGPVNMMAIEQFDELETRHAFLTTQRQDLVEAINQTTEAIRRIDQTTRQRFTEAFTAINRNFQETFGTLFGGGRAGLTLLDENDPLESGIEIIAQPPGKRLQSVQLLSGGEKALTAIALMFGLFKYKPSPFCLLDEIDAPLDDANIGRFVEMLRGMLQHTQFILITHNRKTMEIADRLYGVTMEEPGVSKLISVQMN